MAPETEFIGERENEFTAERDDPYSVAASEDEGEHPAPELVPKTEEAATAIALVPEPISVDASTARAHAPRAPVKGKPVLSRSTRPNPLRRHALAIVAGLWVGISLGAFAGRTTIVRAFPQTAVVYSAIGLPVNLRGLDLRAVKAEFVTTDGGKFLVVEGEIANPRSREVPVPSLDISVRGEGGRALYSWINEAPRQTLGAAEAVHFRARLASPPTEGRQVLVRFASGDDGRELAGEARAP